MKKIISLFLSIVMIFSVLSGSILTAGAAELTDLTFELSEDKKYYIVSDCEYDATGVVTIPAKYNNKPVKEIDYGAFGSVDGITTINIPSSVTKIEGDAFSYCDNLIAINVDANNSTYTSVGGVVFNKKKTTLVVFPSGKTGSYTVPSTVTKIGEWAFYTTLLTSVTLSDSVKTIESYGFGYAKNLTTIKAGSGLKTIGNGAFANCESLTAVDLPSNIMTINASAFSYTPLYDNEGNWKDGVFYVDNHIIKFEDSRCTGSVSIRSGITYIPEYFISYDADVVKSITLPSTVKTVGEYAFYNCDSLTTINFGSGVKKLGARVAGSCDKLTTVKMSSVETIGDYAFYCCPVLKSVTLPETLKTIGEYAFYDCDSLTKITLSKNVKTIGDNAFSWCDKLSTISLTGKVESVGKFTFYQTAYYLNEKKWTDGVLYVGTCLLAVNKYNNNSSTLSVKSGTTCIAQGASDFEYYVKKVKLPSSLLAIGEDAFLECENLKYVTIPKSVKKIGKHAFGFLRDYKNGKDVYTKVSFNIYGTVGSAAQKYAENNKIKFYNVAKVPDLSTPKLKSVVNTSSGVKVTWGKVTGAQGYYVYRKTGSGSWTKIATVKGGSTVSYTDKKAKSGTTYKYTVRAYYVDFYSSYNTKGLTIKRLSTPSLKSVSSAKSGVTFKWGKVTGATGYIVYRKTGSGSWKKLATVKGNSKISYLDKSAKKGTTYTYTVKAYSGDYTGAINSKGLKIKDKY